MAGPTVTEVLTAWRLEPWVTLPLGAAGVLYSTGVRRLGRRGSRAPWPRHRTGFFAAGAAAVFVALQSPVDAYADVLLWVHMVQHLLLVMVASPLLLLGAPVTLALRTGGPRTRRAVARVARSRALRALTHPVTAWLVFAGVIVGTHFSPLYQAALEDEWVHAMEHGLYLAAGLLFWWPVVAVDPATRKMAHPFRVLYVFLAGPVNTITALAISSAGAVLYPRYAQLSRAWGPTPLEDQRIAGALMWVVGDLFLIGSAAIVLGAWARRERAMDPARADGPARSRRAPVPAGDGSPGP